MSAEEVTTNFAPEPVFVQLLREPLPHPHLGEVQVGNNALQFYMEGRELYDPTFYIL